MFLLELAIILFATKSAGYIFKKITLPSVLGEVTAGIILGPSILGIIQQTQTLSHLAEIGVVLLMFVAGIETDLRELRECGTASISTALGGVVVPFVGGAGVAYLFGASIQESLFLGTILTATSVSITVQVLFDMGQLKSKEGLTILGAAVLDDILGIMILTVIAGVTMGGTSIGLLVLKIAVFFAAVWFVLKLRIVKHLAKIVTRMRIEEGLLSFALMVIFFTAFVAEESGIAAIIGAYIAGIMFGQTPYKSKIFKSINSLTCSFFVPIFFVNIGLSADIHHFGKVLNFAVVVIVVAILSKILGCVIGAYAARMNFISALRVGVGMIPRGEVGLIVASMGLKNGLISTSTFSSVVAMVLTTTLITPIILKYAFVIGKKEVLPNN